VRQQGAEEQSDFRAGRLRVIRTQFEYDGGRAAQRSACQEPLTRPQSRCSAALSRLCALPFSRSLASNQVSTGSPLHAGYRAAIACHQAVLTVRSARDPPYAVTRFGCQTACSIAAAFVSMLKNGSRINSDVLGGPLIQQKRQYGV